MPYSVLIVDDEPMARQRIGDLLHHRQDIQVVGECATGKEAVQSIRSLRPDVVFLDVQMPEMDGFDALCSLEEAELPQVIFTTAYDNFALRAFDFHAVDYLLKPYDRDRFQSALDKACRRAESHQQERPQSEVSSLIQELRYRQDGEDRIPVKVDGSYLFLETSSIHWIEAANNYAALHIGPKTHLVRETMTRLEERLPPGQFIRINRSTIVNVREIRELKPKFHGDYSVMLKDGTKLTLSRNYRTRLEVLLEDGLKG